MKKITLAMLLFVCMVSNHLCANHEDAPQRKKSKEVALIKTVGGILLAAASGLMSVASIIVTIEDRDEIGQWLNPKISLKDKPRFLYLIAPIDFPILTALTYVGCKLAQSGVNDLEEIAQYK